MQVYAAPFVLLSILCFLICVAVPRWRGYRFQALVAPVAFGFCSIVAMAVIVLTSDHFNLGLFTKVPSGSLEAVALFMIYFIPGLIGSWGAVAAVTKIVSRCNI